MATAQTAFFLYFTFKNTLSRAKLKKTSYKMICLAKFNDKTIEFIHKLPFLFIKIQDADR